MKNPKVNDDFGARLSAVSADAAKTLSDLATGKIDAKPQMRAPN